MPRAKQESWARAVKMAENALNTADYTERLSMNSGDVQVENKLNTSDNKENKAKETKTKKSKRKSILPSRYTPGGQFKITFILP